MTENKMKRKYPPKMICMSINMAKTGDNIKRLAGDCGYSIDEIMKITGVSTPQAVYKWYSGRSIPSMEILLVLSKVFGIGITKILVIEGDYDREFSEQSDCQVQLKVQ